MPDSITGTILAVSSRKLDNGGERIGIQVDDGTTQRWLSSFDIMVKEIQQGGRYTITYITKPNPNNPASPYYNLVSWKELETDANVGGGAAPSVANGVAFSPGGTASKVGGELPIWTTNVDHRIAWNSAVNNAVPIVTQCFSLTEALDPDKTLAENIRDYYEPAVAEVAAWIYRTICSGPPIEEGEIFAEGELP